MLVLSRKEDQGFTVGPIRVKVLDLHSSYVSIGIEAPKEMLILRDELEVRGVPPIQNVLKSLQEAAEIAENHEREGISRGAIGDQVSLRKKEEARPDVLQ